MGRFCCFVGQFRRGGGGFVICLFPWGSHLFPRQDDTSCGSADRTTWWQEKPQYSHEDRGANSEKRSRTPKLMEGLHSLILTEGNSNCIVKILSRILYGEVPLVNTINTSHLSSHQINASWPWRADWLWCFPVDPKLPSADLNECPGNYKAAVHRETLWSSMFANQRATQAALL